jgi:hypothetical protein
MSHVAADQLARFLAYQRAFDGHDAQRFFVAHWELPLVLVAAYLAVVALGPRLMERRPAFSLRRVTLAWNVSVALFSLSGAAVCVPHLAARIRSHGFWFTVCGDVYELAGYGAPAFWASLFTWSKLLELIDTVLLVLKKRPVITLHWFHHASVILFAWAAWAYETPCALWYGAMNYAVHALMYSYFALMATRCRPTVARFAPAVTALQIAQFGVGTLVNIVAAASYFSASVGCAIQPEILHIQGVMYVAYGALFVQLFYARYLDGKRAQEAVDAASKRRAKQREKQPADDWSYTPMVDTMGKQGRPGGKID